MICDNRTMSSCMRARHTGVSCGVLSDKLKAALEGYDFRSQSQVPCIQACPSSIGSQMQASSQSRYAITKWSNVHGTAENSIICREETA